MKDLSNYGKVLFGQFHTSISTFLIAFCYIKSFWLIARGVLIFQWKVLFSPEIHVTSIYLLIEIVISVIWEEKSILWAYKNKDYLLHWCFIFSNFKFFIQSIILRHTFVKNFYHAKSLLILCSFPWCSLYFWTKKKHVLRGSFCGGGGLPSPSSI